MKCAFEAYVPPCSNIPTGPLCDTTIFECKITGTGEGIARIKASIHTVIESFDDEEWRIITLTVGHLDSQTKYTDLFASSCSSIGDFTDIAMKENHAGDKGYVVPSQIRD